MSQEFSEVYFRERYTLTTDSRICSGCRTCELICSITHGGNVDLELARIDVKQNAFKGSFVPIVCDHCSNAPCYYACTESAIIIDSAYGTILIDEERCTRCLNCLNVCPRHIIKFDQKKNRVIKCDFCNGNPECVKWCPMNALGITHFGGEIAK